LVRQLMSQVEEAKRVNERLHARTNVFNMVTVGFLVAITVAMFGLLLGVLG